MQRSTHAVRYYIVKQDDTAEIRTVPVAIKEADRSSRVQRPALRSAAPAVPVSEPEQSRSRVRRLVHSAVRRVPAER